MISELINSITLLSKNILHKLDGDLRLLFTGGGSYTLYSITSRIAENHWQNSSWWQCSFKASLRRSAVFFNIDLCIGIRWTRERFNTFSRSLSSFLQSNFVKCSGVITLRVWWRFPLVTREWFLTIKNLCQIGHVYLLFWVHYLYNHPSHWEKQYGALTSRTCISFLRGVEGSTTLLSVLSLPSFFAKICILYIIYIYVDTELDI